MTKESCEAVHNSGLGLIFFLIWSLRPRKREGKITHRSQCNVADGSSCSSARQMEKKNNNTSAYMFNYDILKDLMNVDFERIEEEEELKEGEFKPNKEGEDLPF